MQPSDAAEIQGIPLGETRLTPNEAWRTRENPGVTIASSGG